jgi:threonine/homoserine/homoserine lactone efflux protein
MQQPSTQLPQTSQQQNHRLLILGIVVWFLHENILNALTSVACKWHWLTIPVFGLQGVQFVDMFITLIAMLVIGYLVYLGWRNWRSVQTREPLRNPHVMRDTEEDRGAFMAFISMMLNGFFFLFTIATLVLTFSFVACGQS